MATCILQMGFLLVFLFSETFYFILFSFNRTPSKWPVWSRPQAFRTQQNSHPWQVCTAQMGNPWPGRVHTWWGTAIWHVFPCATWPPCCKARKWGYHLPIHTCQEGLFLLTDLQLFQNMCPRWGPKGLCSSRVWGLAFADPLQQQWRWYICMGIQGCFRDCQGYISQSRDPGGSCMWAPPGWCGHQRAIPSKAHKRYIHKMHSPLLFLSIYFKILFFFTWLWFIHQVSEWVHLFTVFCLLQ